MHSWRYAYTIPLICSCKNVYKLVSNATEDQSCNNAYQDSNQDALASQANPINAIANPEYLTSFFDTRAIL